MRTEIGLLYSKAVKVGHDVACGHEHCKRWYVWQRGRSRIAALLYNLMIPPIFNILAEALSLWFGTRREKHRTRGVVVGFRRFITPACVHTAIKYVRQSITSCPFSVIVFRFDAGYDKLNNSNACPRDDTMLKQVLLAVNSLISAQQLDHR